MRSLLCIREVPNRAAMLLMILLGFWIGTGSGFPHTHGHRHTHLMARRGLKGLRSPGVMGLQASLSGSGKLAERMNMEAREWSGQAREARGPIVMESRVESANGTGTRKSGMIKKRDVPSKRGVCYNDPVLANAFSDSSTVSWGYNWAAQPGNLSPRIQYVPMLWGASSEMTAKWPEFARQAIRAGSTELLAFNEPDHQQQARLAPKDAAMAYKKYMSDMFGGSSVRLGSPGVTNGGGSMGLAWLTEFMRACVGCQVDFVAIHWYDSASNIEYFKNHVQKAHEVAAGRPIWITEFGAAGSDSEVKEFMAKALPWLDSQSYVQRYAYFMARDGLLNSGASVSPVGRVYAGVAPDV